MPLPEGRKPLSDRDMINLLRNMVKAFDRNEKLVEEADSIRQTADRFEQLVEKKG